MNINIRAHAFSVFCLLASSVSAQTDTATFGPSDPSQVTWTIGEEIVEHSELPGFINDILLGGNFSFTSYLSRNHTYLIIYFDGPSFCASDDCLRLIVEQRGDTYVNPVLVTVNRDFGLGRDFIPVTEPVYDNCRLQLPEFCIDLVE